ncbi:MAG: PepSY-associated TM helix domain-containing protein [Bacteroidales bacterium]|nr:PepSY-associated TM helix domain-containing protein [Bacteroidales bacterium]
MIKFFRKYHKWLGLGVTLFLLLFSLSGIVLNHRKFFSSVDVTRNILPKEYRYSNWNNASVKGSEQIGQDSILIYGNIGIWLTNNNYTDFSDFNRGLPKGIDNRKIEKIHVSTKNKILAGTYFGLFEFDKTKAQWVKVLLPVEEERITDIIQKNDTILVMTRSFLLGSTNLNEFNTIVLPEPVNYDNKIGLFKTLWVVHSGEIYGIPGIIFVDLVGVIFIFLSLTGLIYFINPYIIKNRIRKQLDSLKVKRVSKFSLKWHNKIGWISILFLIITAATGMFLRPPLLIPIAERKVSKLPYTELDTPNPWFDKLRKIIYHENFNGFLVATSEGVYWADKDLNTELKPIDNQPPISIMGVNSYELMSDTTLLVGSFEGLFLWNFTNGEIINAFTKKAYQKPERRGPPIGENMVAGLITKANGEKVVFDFNSGASIMDSRANFVKMPEKIQQQAISLWNVALEFHTARIYKVFMGGFYILIVPLTGLFTLFILISGFIVWIKLYWEKPTS